MVTAQFLVFNLLIFRPIPLQCTVLPHAASAAAYEEFQPGKKLVNHEILSLRTGSANMCSQACNRETFCLSFNFCDNFFCQLNSQDIFSTELGEDLLQDDSSCSYFGMGRAEVPKCKEGDSQVNIQVPLQIKNRNNSILLKLSFYSLRASNKIVSGPT